MQVFRLEAILSYVPDDAELKFHLISDGKQKDLKLVGGYPDDFDYGEQAQTMVLQFSEI